MFLEVDVYYYLANVVILNTIRFTKLWFLIRDQGERNLPYFDHRHINLIIS